MKLPDWLKDIGEEFTDGFWEIPIDQIPENLHISGECQACAHWEKDLKFCKERKEIGWKPDDGCIKWVNL